MRVLGFTSLSNLVPGEGGVRLESNLRKGGFTKVCDRVVSNIKIV